MHGFITLSEAMPYDKLKHFTSKIFLVVAIQHYFPDTTNTEMQQNSLDKIVSFYGITCCLLLLNVCYLHRV